MGIVRWGIIGCGSVTEVKSGPGFQLASNSELIAVMRRNGQLAEDYAKRHNVKRWYDDASKLIADPEVDAIYIATPPDSHRDYVLMAAKAGKPVYVEKPMGRTHKECVEMIKACESAQVKLYVAYYRRGLPRFLKIKELLDQQRIGEVRYATMKQHQSVRDQDIGEAPQWRVQPEIAGGGKFYDLASHTLDIMALLLGDITEAKGYSSNQAGHYQANDMVSASVLFDGTIHGNGSWCFAAFEDYDMNEIIGSEGKLRFSTFGSEPIELITKEGITTYPIDNPRHIQQPLIQTVVDDLNGAATCLSTGISAARTNWVLEQIANKGSNDEE